MDVSTRFFLSEPRVFNEPKNGDFASMVENLSSDKLDAIRQENEALFKSAATSNPESQRPPISKSEAEKKVRALLEAWQREKSALQSAHSEAFEDEDQARVLPHKEKELSPLGKFVFSVGLLAFMLLFITFLEDFVYALADIVESFLLAVYP